jgi:hypothetical protein
MGALVWLEKLNQDKVTKTEYLLEGFWPIVAGESQISDGRPAGSSICALQNNKPNFLSETKSVSTYYIGSSCNHYHSNQDQ